MSNCDGCPFEQPNGECIQVGGCNENKKWLRAHDSEIRRQAFKEVYEMVSSDALCDKCNYKTKRCVYNCGDNEWNIDALIDWLTEQMKGE